MKFYLGGPMRGLPNYNFDEFEAGTRYLRRLDHEVISPHEIDLQEGLVIAEYRANATYPHLNLNSYFVEDSVQLTDKFSIEAALRRDFAAILEVDAVAFLSGWKDSTGCYAEDFVREKIGIPRYYITPFVELREDVGAP